MSNSDSPTKKRLSDLRIILQAEALDGFLVPMADPYLNEYVPPSDQRIEFLSGFTGSFAFILVLMEKAIFFTDSRYTLQAEEEVPFDHFELLNIAQKSVGVWMKENLTGSQKIGFDPRLHSAAQIEKLQKDMACNNIKLQIVKQNPLDQIWHDQPKATRAPITAHEEIYTGKSSALKREELAQELQKRNLSATIITDPSSVAWLLNIRGNDIPDTPLPLSTAILHADASLELFINQSQFSKELDTFLGNRVTIHKEDYFVTAINNLGKTKNRVLIDPTETPYIFIDHLLNSGSEIERGDNLCALPRACKNPTEIDGMRAAHRRDGAALVRLLAWLDTALPSHQITEFDVVTKLEELRAFGSLHKGQSFPTIAGSGPNGAIVHYCPTEKTSRLIDQDSFLLIDSGAQYLDGTTDVTRTISTGNLTHEMRDRFTRVLKGHIALASIRFPSGTNGADLDVLARQYLWEIGEDYGHGTGHGVGSYLCVHEGPHGISHGATTTLRKGMVTSNEPGFYKARHYGIRHENLQYVVELLDISSPDRKMLGFEPLTLAPFDRRSILIEILTEPEKDWLNAYHARVAKAILPQLDSSSGAWLIEATKPL